MYEQVSDRGGKLRRQKEIENLIIETENNVNRIFLINDMNRKGF